MATKTATREIEGRDSVGLYLDEIARNDLLDAAKEVELSKAIEAGLMAEHLLAQGRVGRKAPGGATRAELEGKGVRFLVSRIADVARVRTSWFIDPWGVVFILVEKSRPERPYFAQWG